MGAHFGIRGVPGRHIEQAHAVGAMLREGKVERHIRLLAPLAFIPPRTLTAIIDSTGPHDATVTALAQAVPYRWDRNPAGQGSEQ
jgi:hypothetical protein